MADVYQIVTERILNALTLGEVPWHKPWCSVTGGAFNRVTGRPYSLLNQMLLTRSGEYASIKQWTKLGGRLRQGEKSEIVVFWKWPEKKVENTGGEVEEKSVERKDKPILRYYHVFHVSQIDGVSPVDINTHLYDSRPIDRAEKLFDDYCTREGIEVECELTNEAYYSPIKDIIHIPDIRQYKYAEEYYSTAFHEVVHSTGRMGRLERKGLQTVAFGSETYSKEELIAEIGCACLLNHLGIETDHSFRNSTGYIQGWLNSLQKDRKLVVIAASQAEKAVRFIIDNDNSQR